MTDHLSAMTIGAINRRSLLAGAAAAGGAMLISGRGRAQDAEWQKIVEAGKKEGEVNFYGSTFGVPWHVAAQKSFEAKYGIKVNVLDARSSELNQRVQAEQTAHKVQGDVIQHTTSAVELFTKNGWAQPYGKVPNAAGVRDPFTKMITPTHMPTYVLGYGILINTELVKPADEPKTWHDLLDPKWKGKMLADDFRALGGGSNWFFASYDAFGRDFHEKLAKQDVVFDRDVGNSEQRVARGEYPLRFPQLYSNFTQFKGLPVKLIAPEEGASYVQIESMMFNDAPHPNAAKLFVDHYIGPEVQLIYANANLVPVANGVLEKASPEAKKIASTKLLGTTTGDRQDQMLQIAKEIYK